MPVAVVEPRVEAPFEVALRIEERAVLERVPARLGLDSDRPCLVLGGGDGLGGEISCADVEASVAAQRPVVAVAGSGRTADALAAAVRGTPGDRCAARLAACGRVHVADLADPRGIERLLLDLLRS